MPLMIDIEDLAVDLDRVEAALAKWKALDRLTLSGKGLSVQQEQERRTAAAEYTLPGEQILATLFDRLRNARQSSDQMAQEILTAPLAGSLDDIRSAGVYRLPTGHTAKYIESLPNISQRSPVCVYDGDKLIGQAWTESDGLKRHWWRDWADGEWKPWAMRWPTADKGPFLPPSPDRG